MSNITVSKAPVAAPDVIVAWRTASDAHIRLAIFEGDSALHNAVTTEETSPYAPALSEPFLGWTGMDAAQSVNVTAENI